MEKHSKTLRVLVTPSFLSQIAEAAGERRTTVSAFVREAIEVQLSRDPRLLERLEAKVALLRELSAQEGMVDEAIRTVGGDPAQAERTRRLDLQSKVALLRGAIPDSKPILHLLGVLIQLHGELGPERLREEVNRALAELPKRDRGAAGRRIEAAEGAMAYLVTAGAAP